MMSSKKIFSVIAGIGFLVLFSLGGITGCSSREKSTGTQGKNKAASTASKTRTNSAASVAVTTKTKTSAIAGSSSKNNQNAIIEAIKHETKAQKDARMAWWRKARFGMFIHWGIYSVPAGEWKGKTGYAEWIMNNAHIPVKQYEKFAAKFNPVKFNADRWVKLAKEAGMKYIVITTKHHDGFCMFGTKLTKYNVVDATPYKKDIMKAMAAACKKYGIKMCWYYSIMDWHNFNYLPRRSWEKRTTKGADFSKYVKYMRGQLKELLTNYGKIGVLWFDGEWERTWNADLGDALYYYVRSLQPSIIVNNRVSKGRAGMSGTYDPGKFVGDFGTPEQRIPATGLGYDWETCMTMNNHWGYNKHDNNWKSAPGLIHRLIDIASKGGNFLLNVGPTSEGTFPQPAIDRLKAIGKWMKVNGDSIYGTTASLFENLPWGRSTTKGNTIYLHVFDWPQKGELVVPGLITQASSVYFLANPNTFLNVKYKPGQAVIAVPPKPLNDVATVIVMKFNSKPEVIHNPKIEAEKNIFYNKMTVKLSGNVQNSQIHYTLDGTEPTAKSAVYKQPITLTDDTVVKCVIVRQGKVVSGVSQAKFHKASLNPAVKNITVKPGIDYSYYEGHWNTLPKFDTIKAVASGVTNNFGTKLAKRKEFYALHFAGYISVPKDGIYTFYLASDDGSCLYIDGKLAIDNNGLHSAQQKTTSIGLKAGLHSLVVDFFQGAGDVGLNVAFSGPGIKKRNVSAQDLFHKAQ